MTDTPIKHEALYSLEASVLGAILNRNDVLAQFPRLEVADFVLASHRHVFTAMRNLEAENRPIDVVTVQAEIAKRGIQSLGFAELGLLTLHVPTVDNAIEYVRQIRDAGLGRRVRAALGDLLSRADETNGAELLTMTMAALSKIDEDQPDATTGIMELVKKRFKQLEQIAQERASGARTMTGFPTGVAKLDEKLGGWQPGIVTIVAARPSHGKAQPLDAKVLTPTGWRLMGELAVGDLVIGGSGKPVPVVAVHERGDLEIKRVTLSDGAATECCADHMWLTRTNRDRKNGRDGTPKSTAEIATTMARGDGGRNHSIPLLGPVEFQALTAPLPVDPYMLGLYLGDGHMTGSVHLTNPEPDVRARFLEALPVDCVGVLASDVLIRVKARVERRTAGGWPERSSLAVALESLGLRDAGSPTKFVPVAYLMGTADVRLAVLRGLLDTDGYVVAGGRLIEYSTTSPRLRDDVRFLVGSLGGVTSCSEHMGRYTKDGTVTETRTAWRILCRFPAGNVTPVSTAKHLARWRGGPTKRPERYIARVTAAGRKTCRCITVGAEDGLYVTDEFIVTHNSSLGLATADGCSAGGFGAHLFSLEDTEAAYADRTIARTSSVSAEKLRNADLNNGDCGSIVRAMGGLRGRRWLVDGRSGITADEVVRSVRRHRKDNGTCVAIVDYVQLVKHPDRKPRLSSHEALTEIVTTFADAAKHDGLAYVVMSQLNREIEKRQDKRPQLADLRESGSLEERAKCVVAIYKGSKYGGPVKGIDWDPEWEGHSHAPDENQHEAQIQLLVLKNSNGRTGTVFAHWHGPTTKIE